MSLRSCAALALDLSPEALTYYQEALAIYREFGDLEWEALILDRIGRAYWSLSRYREASAHYQASLAIDRELGDRELEPTPGGDDVLLRLWLLTRSLAGGPGKDLPSAT